MEALKKLHEARKAIKTLNLKKLGRNDYSEYDYYTPEQVSGMKAKVFDDLNMIDQFSLVRTDLGLMAKLVITDLDSGKNVTFEIATEIPEIKATNVAQQLGGAVTYSERYLTMIALDIKDNNLDFDTEKLKQETIKPDQKKETDERPWLDDKTIKNILGTMRLEKPTMIGSVTFNNNNEIVDYVTKKYRMKKVYKEQLMDELNCELNKAFNNE